MPSALKAILLLLAPALILALLILVGDYWADIAIKGAIGLVIAYLTVFAPNTIAHLAVSFIPLSIA